jgi:hypothetical protein
MPEFLDRQRTLDNYWRAVILFGRNVASYTFALGQSLLELSAWTDSVVRLEELAAQSAIQESIAPARGDGAVLWEEFVAIHRRRVLEVTNAAAEDDNPMTPGYSTRTRNR